AAGPAHLPARPGPPLPVDVHPAEQQLRLPGDDAEPLECHNKYRYDSPNRRPPADGSGDHPTPADEGAIVQHYVHEPDAYPVVWHGPPAGYGHRLRVLRDADGVPVAEYAGRARAGRPEPAAGRLPDQHDVADGPAEPGHEHAGGHDPVPA